MTLQLPKWPPEDTAGGKLFFSAAREVVSLWKTRDVSLPFALGMLANAEAESSIDPCELGDYVDVQGHKLPWMSKYEETARPTAFHLHQWHTERCTAVKAGTGIDLMGTALTGTATIRDGVEAAHWELTGPAWKARIAIESQHSAYTAAYQACVLFERAGASDAAARRGTMAERWSVWFINNGF